MTQSDSVFVVGKAQHQELKKGAPAYFTLVDDKAPPAARDKSEVARVLS